MSHLACWLAASGAAIYAVSCWAAEQQPVVAATVDDTAIYVSEVDRELELVLRRRQVELSARAAMRFRTLQQLVDRQLVLLWLAETQQAASTADVELAVQRLQRRLQREGRTLEEHARQLGLEEAGLHASLHWQLSWERFLARHLTEENLARFFETHRREFDGTRLRVAHILWPCDRPGDVQANLERARVVREQILRGELTFAVAAQRYSNAPSRNTGGELGFIGRHGPMSEAFSRAAFQLAEGDVSEPVATSFGVHLIHCLEVEPGQGSWRAAQPELADAATEYLFRWAADQSRSRAAIRFSGAVPDPAAGSEGPLGP